MKRKPTLLFAAMFLISSFFSTGCQEDNKENDEAPDDTGENDPEDTGENSPKDTGENDLEDPCEKIDCDEKGQCKTNDKGDAFCECKNRFWNGPPESSIPTQCVKVTPSQGWDSLSTENNISYHTTVTILPEDVGYDEAMVGMDFAVDFNGEIAGEGVGMAYSLGLELEGNEQFGDSILIIMYPMVGGLRERSNGIEINTIIEKKEILASIERGDYTVTTALVDTIEKFAVAPKYEMKGTAELVLYAYCTPAILSNDPPQTYFVDGTRLDKVSVGEKFEIWGNLSLASTQDQEAKNYLEENGYSICHCLKNLEADISEIVDEAEQIEALGIYQCDEPILPACWGDDVRCGKGTCSLNDDGKAVCDCAEGYNNDAQINICVKTEN